MPTRRRYPELGNHAWVAIQLQTKSPQELAEEIGCPASCIHWVIKRYLSKEQREMVNYERKHNPEGSNA